MGLFTDVETHPAVFVSGLDCYKVTARVARGQLGEGYLPMSRPIHPSGIAFTSTILLLAGTEKGKGRVG